LVVRENNDPLKNLLIYLLWLCTGILSWYLSKYLFSYVVSPVFINWVRKVNTIMHSAVINGLVNLFYTYLSQFLLCFVFAMILSVWTACTRLRLALFVAGAIAVGTYANIQFAAGAVGTAAGTPAWITTIVLQAVIAMLIIVPLLSKAGCKLGHFIKMKIHSARQQE
jgi:hypothetical protein